MEAVIEGEEITKSNLISPEIHSYKLKKLETIRKGIKENPVSLLEESGDDYEAERYPAKKKEPKKSTLEQTLELWQGNVPIAEIARIRKLTETTILSHFAGLIQVGKINISEVLPEDKIASLTKAFEGFEGESLSELKENHGDEFSWSDLKLFKASIRG